MPGIVPQLLENSGEGTGALGLALDALLEFTNAACGWVGVLGADQRLAFPIRRGLLPEAWLKFQRGEESPWGFAFREGPTLLNDLRPWPDCDPAPLKSLLSCPLQDGGTRCGHVVIANKASGFTSHDAAVIQGVAHVMGKLVGANSLREKGPPGLTALPPEALEHLDEGIFILDERGVLVFANAVWAKWTGFAPAELVGQRPPFAFWISHRHLAELGGTRSFAPAPDKTDVASAVGARATLPFRRHDDSVFWCQVESRRLEWSGQRWLLAVLHASRDTKAVLAKRRKHFSG